MSLPNQPWIANDRNNVVYLQHISTSVAFSLSQGLNTSQETSPHSLIPRTRKVVTNARSSKASAEYKTAPPMKSTRSKLDFQGTFHTTQPQQTPKGLVLRKFELHAGSQPSILAQFIKTRVEGPCYQSTSSNIPSIKESLPNAVRFSQLRPSHIEPISQSFIVQLCSSNGYTRQKKCEG